MTPPQRTPVLPVTELSEALHAARDFDTACALLLRSLFERVADHQPRGSIVLRGSIHFRPDNEYRRLYCLENDTSSSSEPPLRLPSVTAWRWIGGKGCPVGIDVEAQLLHVYEGGAPRLFRDDSSAIRLNSGETCQRLTARDADYVLAYPLRRHAGIVDGMVSLELKGTNGVGEQVQSTCGSVLQLLVDLAAPHLANLPGAAPKQEIYRDEYLPVVGASTAPLVDLLRVFSRLDETLLIAGPTGVGKSRLARYCHVHSPRRNKPFVTLDLQSCPESLQMPQLCGARKGAYTGADRDIPGAIQRAEGGTLFIDEVDKLSLQAQAGLLRLLEDRVYRSIGDCGDDRKADVRFIVGTTANLKEAVQQGRFREDLYYRIAVLLVRVPPLCERRDETQHWAKYMLERCHSSVDNGKRSTRVELSDHGVGILSTQNWPGNLRQLDNVMRRSYAYSLLDHTEGGDVIVVSRTQLERAIRDEMDAPRVDAAASLEEKMRATARAFAEVSLQRANSARPLPLALADSFRAMVLEVAIENCGPDKDLALQALGLGSVVRDRNLGRVLNRAREQLQNFGSSLMSLPSEARPPKIQNDAEARECIGAGFASRRRSDPGVAP